MPLDVSKDHVVFVNGATLPASIVTPGKTIDLVTSEKKTRAEAKQIKVVVRNGVYAPFTTSGTIVASGVAVSN
jgi:predicted metallopeptidase